MSKRSGCLFAQAGMSGFGSWEDFCIETDQGENVPFQDVRSVEYSRVYHLDDGKTPARAVLLEKIRNEFKSQIKDPRTLYADGKWQLLHVQDCTQPL